jgi:putative hydrolase of HD superfamily
MNLNSLLDFIREIDRLKTVERQTLLHNSSGAEQTGGRRRENSAEHSWHLAMAVLVFHGLAEPGTDLLKSLKMALLHDLVEIDAGDVFVYTHNPDKFANESAAIRRLTESLPAPIGEELRTVWFEFEEGQCAEARFVAALDRFLPMFSNYLNQGHSWHQHGIKLEQVVAKNKPPISSALPDLWAHAEAMLNESVAKGHLERS